MSGHVRQRGKKGEGQIIMSKRKNHGYGLVERSPGHWAIIIDDKDRMTGKRKRVWHSFHGSRTEAKVEARRLLGEKDAGKRVDPTKVTVAVFLGRWLEHMQARLLPRAHERYGEIARKNIIPLLGDIPLQKLQALDIDAAYSKALISGRRDGKGGLAPATVHYMHRILRQVLQQAVQWRMLAINPADTAEPPKVERKEMSALDPVETARLIEAARNERLFIAYLLGVMCGLRRGEVAALRWRSVDLATGQLSVSASIEQTSKAVREKLPKSGKGRTVALLPMLVDELRQHRIRQAEHLLALGVRLSDDHHVVMREDGHPYQPRSLTHAFQIFRAKHGLDRVRLHDLRHTHATHLLAAGIHPKVAQERLGHSSIAITLDLYSHVMPGMQAQAAERVNEVLSAAIQKRAQQTGK
jgi:integrase